MSQSGGHKLDSHLQFQPTEAAIGQILGQYDLKLQSFSLATSGIENTTVLVQTDRGGFVVRIYRQKNKDRESILPELDFMQYLQRHRIPVPEVLQSVRRERIVEYVHSGTTWLCLVMHLMPGTHPRNYTSELMRSMAVIQAQMHLFGSSFVHERALQQEKFSGNQLRGKWHARDVVMEKITVAAVIDFLTRATAFEAVLPADTPIGFNHLDYDHANLLAEGDAVTAVLDFDDAAVSPVVICLGYTLWNILFVTGDVLKLKEYLGYYESVRPLSQSELLSLRDTMLFRNYMILCILIDFWGEKSEKTRVCLSLEKLIQGLSEADFR
jgi:Ser/Thr protein kinase RdoA (MazF antagonist)